MVLLPQTEGLNIEAFSRLFEDTATSYKYLFFLAILHNLEQKEFFISSEIALRDLALEMLILAWEPYRNGMSFGTQDKIIKKLQMLNLPKDLDSTQIRARIKEQVHEPLIDLMRYVPFRLIRPFFNDDLRGLSDQKVNSRILEMVAEQYESQKLLYQFSEDRRGILIHPDWQEYIRDNYAIIKSWVTSEWNDYLQRRNSSNFSYINSGMANLSIVLFAGWQLLDLQMVA